jgi:uncharacterized coiled-coil protein SlyX
MLMGSAAVDVLQRQVRELTAIIAGQKALIGELQAVIAAQKTEIGGLKDEIALLKGLKPRPTFPPSRMEDGTDEVRKPNAKRSSKGTKRPRNGGEKSRRTSDLVINEDKVLKPEAVPVGSRFKGRKRFVVQDLIVQPHVTRYHRERYVTPDGQTLVAPLPSGIVGHYGPSLVAFVLYQHYEQKVPELKILDLLHGVGIKISLAQLNDLLTQGKENFHAEKAAILQAGLAVSSALTVDDTSARHKGKAAVTTHIGNELFAWFSTTDSKSRRNFFGLILEAGVPEWRVNADAAEHWQQTGLAEGTIRALMEAETKLFDTRSAWNLHLDALGIVAPQARSLSTEGALWGSISHQKLLEETVVVSDGAPQFVTDLHARCWIHAERQIQRINCATPEQQTKVDRTRTRVWALYRALKAYKRNPDPNHKRRLSAWFDRIFNRKTGFGALDAVLDALFDIKAELLLVLDRPDIPLHTNISEGDIRCRVEERKISGCTRGEEGKRCNDTFGSISKTLRKHAIPFLHYLRDRLGLPGPKVPPLVDIIRKAAEAKAQPRAQPAPA